MSEYKFSVMYGRLFCPIVVGWCELDKLATSCLLVIDGGADSRTGSHLSARRLGTTNHRLFHNTSVHRLSDYSLVVWCWVHASLGDR